MRIVALGVSVVLCLIGSTAHSSECQIPSSDNPNITYSINPNVTYRLNPDVTYAINPNVTYSINPNVTYRYNPSVTHSINPEVTTSLNPNLGEWSGYYVCSPDGRRVGASVIASEEVMVLYAGQKWIGHFVTNKRGGYNFFNRDNEWKGFLVPTSSGGYASFISTRSGPCPCDLPPGTSPLSKLDLGPFEVHSMG